MIYRTYVPAPPLAKYIERFWHCSASPISPPTPAVGNAGQILPSGRVEMVFNLSDNEICIRHPSRLDKTERFPGTSIAGPYRRCFIVQPQPREATVGIHFKPGGAYPFLGSPVNELADTHQALSSLWGQEATDLHERLCTSPTPENCFALLEEFLLERLAHRSRPQQLVEIALRAFESEGFAVRTREMAARVGLSQRRFIEMFAAEVGLTPKLYCRVRRFEWARNLAHANSVLHWADVAATCGYFDQSHMIRDFLELSGQSPSDLLQRSSQSSIPINVLLVG